MNFDNVANSPESTPPPSIPTKKMVPLAMSARKYRGGAIHVHEVGASVNPNITRLSNARFNMSVYRQDFDSQGAYLDAILKYLRDGYIIRGARLTQSDITILGLGEYVDTILVGQKRIK